MSRLEVKPSSRSTFDLDPQALAVEAVLVALVLAEHRVEALVQVLVRPTPRVVDAHRVVGGDGAVEERPGLPCRRSWRAGARRCAAPPRASRIRCSWAGKSGAAGRGRKRDPDPGRDGDDGMCPKDRRSAPAARPSATAGSRHGAPPRSHRGSLGGRSTRRRRGRAATIRRDAAPDARPWRATARSRPRSSPSCSRASGQMYCRRLPARRLLWMVPWLVAVALVAGTAFSMGLRGLRDELRRDTSWLRYLVVGIGVDLLWRLLSVLDAWWVARAPKGVSRWPAAARRVRRRTPRDLLVLLVSHADGRRGQVYGRTTTCAASPADRLRGRARRDPASRTRTTPDRRSGRIDRAPALAARHRSTPRRRAERHARRRAHARAARDSSGRRLNILLVGTNGSLTDTMIVVSIDRRDRAGRLHQHAPRHRRAARSRAGSACHARSTASGRDRANQIYNLTKDRSDCSRARTSGSAATARSRRSSASRSALDIDYYVQVDMDGFRTS